MEEKNKYENIPVSAKTRKGMSLTSDDTQYLGRMLTVMDDSWNDAFDKSIAELTKALAEVIQAQNDRMFETLEAQNKLIMQIRDDVILIKDRLEKLEASQGSQDVRLILLEKYAGWGSTIIRIIFAAVMGAAIALGLHSLIK